jgi:hypothetical protein
MPDLLKRGLHPDASDALRAAGIQDFRIGQTIGGAPASHGVHLQDGTANGHPYTAATDLKVRDLTLTQIRDLLPVLAVHGFAPFARIPGRDHWPDTEALHVHIVYGGCAMKRALRDQIHAFCHAPMLNGLRSNLRYHFWQPTPEAQQVVRALFLAHNPVNG